MKKCSYGLALEGGGAKGAFQVGAYKALMESGFKFDAIVGTSIGAINAAIICAGDFEKLEELWNRIDSKVFQIDPKICDEIINNDKKKKMQSLLDILKRKGISFDNLREVLNVYVDEEKVRNSKIKFGLVMTKVKGFKSCELTIDEIPKGKLIDYLIYSSSLPIFKIEKNEDGAYLDGAFKNVLPLSFLEDLGCKNIIGIRLKKFGIIKKLKNKDTKVTLVEPSKSTGSTIYFNHKTVKENIDLGYKDTKKVIAKMQ